MKAVVTTTTKLADFLASAAALEHIATYGWRKPPKVDDGRGITRKKNYSGCAVNHDGSALRKHDWLRREVNRAIMNCGIMACGIASLPRIYEDLSRIGARTRLLSLDKRLGELSKLVDDWLDDRQTQALGCDGRLEDCFGNYDRCCGWLTAEGGCKLGRQRKMVG